MSDKIVIMCEGESLESSPKTAISLLKYREVDIVGVIDSQLVGKKACEVFSQVSSAVPFVRSFKDLPEANVMMIGIAPAGGKLPLKWRSMICEALEAGLSVHSGLHTFFSDDAEFVAAAKKGGATIVDIRKNVEKEVATGAGFNDRCLRVHTVGHDCNVGKMVVSIEITNELKRRGRSCSFVATGQTGIMISGDGCPVDAVVCDFLNGSVEKLVQRHQENDFLVIEGQGSLYNPLYSPVTLGLLHGGRPQALIMCYEAVRKHIIHLPGYPISPLPKLIETFEMASAIFQPAKVLGVAVNGKGLSKAEIAEEVKRVSGETGLPACDVYQDGSAVLADAVVAYREQLVKENKIKDVK